MSRNYAVAIVRNAKILTVRYTNLALHEARAYSSTYNFCMSDRKAVVMRQPLPSAVK